MTKEKDPNVIIGKWKNEINCVEEVMDRPNTSKEWKGSLTIQLSNAQVMLKQALILASNVGVVGKTAGMIGIGKKAGDPKSKEKRYYMDIDEEEKQETDKADGENLQKYNSTMLKGRSGDGCEEVTTGKLRGTYKTQKEKELRWADMSDDETVILTNMDDKGSNDAKW